MNLQSIYNMYESYFDKWDKIMTQLRLEILKVTKVVSLLPTSDDRKDSDKVFL